uniref:PBPe domain-containing protein n=1 Tax=Heterorhabditis bacteriophora TaxID=37862 RepID=A0A1I7WNT1_HETBA
MVLYVCIAYNERMKYSKEGSQEDGVQEADDIKPILFIFGYLHNSSQLEFQKKNFWKINSKHSASTACFRSSTGSRIVVAEVLTDGESDEGDDSLLLLRENSTLHGLRDLLLSSTCQLRFIWTIILIFAISLTMHGVWQIIHEFQLRSVVISYFIQEASIIENITGGGFGYGERIVINLPQHLYNPGANQMLNDGIAVKLAERGKGIDNDLTFIPSVFILKNAI